MTHDDTALAKGALMPPIPVPYLHVAGPDALQGRVHIVGTTAGLRALLHATLDALLSHRPRHRVTCAPTGDTAELRVEMVTEPRWHSLTPEEP